MPKSPKSAPPRSNLTLEQHWQIIQYKKEHPTLSTAEIARVFAEKFNHPTLNQSTVSRTLNKEDRLRPFSTHTTRKKISQVRCPEVEEALMKWYSVEMEQGNVVTGPMLRSQAIKIADDMGIPEDQRPKYSNGWLDCYKSRHQLKFGNRPQSNSHSHSHSQSLSQRGSPASSASVSVPTSSSLGSAHVQIQSRLAAQQQSLQQSQVQVPPHLHRPATIATSSLTPAPAPSSAPAHSLPTPHSPFYTSPTLHMKSEPSEPDLDVDVDADADGDADEDLETDSDISGTSYPSRSPSCCSYGGYPAYAYPSYPSYSTSHPHSHSHRHSHSYPSYTSSNAYQCSACPPPHHLPHPSTTATTTTTTNHSIPPQQEDEISRAVKSLKLHLESCPTLAPNRGNLLANMKVIECAVSDCRSSIGGDDDEDGDAELEQRMDVAVSGRVMGGVVIPRPHSHSHSRSQEPLSPLSPISTTIDSIPRPTTTGGVSVPPRRQRWLDLVTSPTDSDYSQSNSHSNPGSVGGSPASTSMVH